MDAVHKQHMTIRHLCLSSNYLLLTDNAVVFGTGVIISTQVTAAEDQLVCYMRSSITDCLWSGATSASHHRALMRSLSLDFLSSNVFTSSLRRK